EINQIEAYPALARRGNLDLSAALRQSLQRRLEHRPADRVEDNLCAAAARGAGDDGIEARAVKDKEIVNRARRRRIRSRLMLINTDDARAAPFADLRRRAADAAVGAYHEQRFSGGDPRVLDQAEPGGEVNNADGRGLLQRKR